APHVTALLDLSGSRAPNGGPQRDALQLWADQHSTATPRVKLKIVDVASSPSRTALELRRAAVEDRADAIVVGVSVDYDDAFVAAVQLTGVPVLFTLPIPEPAARGGGGWAFALAPTPAQLARSVLDDATLRSVLSTDLVVSDESTTAIGERIALTNELARRRVTANVITVTPTDATQKLRPLLVTTPIVFLAGTPRSYVEAARTVTVGTSLYLSYLCDFSDIADLHEAAALVVWPGSRWIAASSSGTSGAARAAFVQSYTDRTGPPTSLAASAYDALGLLASAADGGTAPSDVRDRLQSRTFTGDATWPIAEYLAAELPNVRAIHLDAKGRGRALRTAWLSSEAAIVAYMDVDLSTDLDALLPLVAPLMSGHSDVAIGSRLARGARVRRGPKRELISRAYNFLLHIGLGAQFSDAQCGFKAITAVAARRLIPAVQDQAWFFDTELLVLAQRAGMRIHEVPVDWTDDPDSRVDIAKTAVDDLRGILRLRFGDVPPALSRQVLTFGSIGLASTIAYAIVYALLRVLASPAMPMQIGSTHG